MFFAECFVCSGLESMLAIILERHVHEILGALGRVGVTLKLANCSFFTDRIKHLEHIIIRPGTLEIEEAATRSLTGLRNPQSYTELRRLLGLCNVYRRFIKGFRIIASPLYSLLKGSPLPKEFPGFGPREERAYRTLIEKVTSPPVLALPRLVLKYSVDTDACDYQIGCALFQTDGDGERKPLGFWSRTLAPAEPNYSTTEKEWLAVIFAVQICRLYLEGEKFTIFTDHAAYDGSWRLMTCPAG